MALVGGRGSVLRMRSLLLLLFVVFACGVCAQEQAEKAAVNEVPQVKEKTFEECIEMLASEEFADRAQAREGIFQLAENDREGVKMKLLAAYDGTENPEVKCQCREIYLNMTGFLGIKYMALRTNGEKPTKGCKVDLVIEGMPGAQAGLLQGDVIVSVDGHEFDAQVEPQKFFAEYVQAHTPGHKIKVKYLRQGNLTEVEVKLREMPEKLILPKEKANRDLLFQSELNSFRQHQKKPK